MDPQDGFRGRLMQIPNTTPCLTARTKVIEIKKKSKNIMNKSRLTNLYNTKVFFHRQATDPHLRLMWSPLMMVLDFYLTLATAKPRLEQRCCVKLTSGGGHFGKLEKVVIFLTLVTTFFPPDAFFDWRTSGQGHSKV